MTKLDEYLRISEAAEYVGVAPNTLNGRRQPVNGYRLYARDDLDALFKKVDEPKAKTKHKRKPR